MNNGVLARQMIATPSSPVIKQKIAKEVENALKADKDLNSKVDLTDLAYSLSTARPAGAGNYIFNLKIYAKKINR